MSRAIAIFSLTTFLFLVFLFKLSPSEKKEGFPYGVYTSALSFEDESYDKGSIDFSEWKLPAVNSKEWAQVVENNQYTEVLGLLESGQMVDQIINNKGLVALHVFAQRGNKIMVSLLLEKGANPHRLSQEGLSALDYAQRQGHEEVASLIQNALVVTNEAEEISQEASISSNEKEVGQTPNSKVNERYLDKILHPYESIKSILR
ncbi:hypothetical protein AB751O23_AA_00510 [Chlamydiales bacterium SCGC AB-751-O23]|jgi:ankyrin repeat protein|nr:hypothetical protein AB751O23_AA_00510 [Chlamydiales bacterium SCGC AB-751-O23]